MAVWDDDAKVYLGRYAHHLETDTGRTTTGGERCGPRAERCRSGRARDRTTVWFAAPEERRADVRRQRWRAGWPERISVPGRRSGYASASRGSTRSARRSSSGSPGSRAFEPRRQRPCATASESRTGHLRATSSRSSVPFSPAGRTCIPGAGRIPGRGRPATRRSATTSGSAACATNPECGAGPVPVRRSCRSPMKPWRGIFAGATPWASIRRWPTILAGSSPPISTRRRGDAGAYLAACRAKEIPAVVERSRSGNGAHVWLFFEGPVAASLARRLGAHILTEAMGRTPEWRACGAGTLRAPGLRPGPGSCSHSCCGQACGRRERVADAVFKAHVPPIEGWLQPSGGAQIGARGHDAEHAGQSRHAHAVGRMRKGPRRAPLSPNRDSQA